MRVEDYRLALDRCATLGAQGALPPLQVSHEQWNAAWGIGGFSRLASVATCGGVLVAIETEAG